jgi:hypothetical protein
MIRTEGFKNPKKWSQDWIGGFIKKKQNNTKKILKSKPKVAFEIKNHNIALNLKPQ